MSTNNIPKYVTGPRDKILASTPGEHTIAKSTDTSELFIRINGGWEIYSFNRGRGSGGHGTYSLYGTVIDAPISSHIDASDPTTMTDTNGVQLSPDAEETFIAGGVRHIHNRDVISHLTNHNPSTIGTSRASYDPTLFGGAGGIHFPAKSFMQQIRNYNSNGINEQTYFIVYEYETHFEQENPLKDNAVSFAPPLSPHKDPNATADDKSTRPGTVVKILEGLDVMKYNATLQEGALHLQPVARPYNGELNFLQNYAYGNRANTTANSSTTLTTQADAAYKALNEETLRRFKTPRTEKGIMCIRQSVSAGVNAYNERTGENSHYHRQADYSLTTLFGNYTLSMTDAPFTPVVNPSIGAIHNSGYVNIAEFVMIDDYITTTDMQNIIQGMCNKFDLPYLG